ncbi:MAG TPA: hypothetical protein VLJ68_08820, partial [Chitinophagaceae bacterium]|nr:hypothetical protein [Chitinophagaceae bacterium]
IEISFQNTGASQANQGSNKNTGGGELPFKQPPGYSLYFSACGSALIYFHSKSYLSHNYPSHNFW